MCLYYTIGSNIYISSLKIKAFVQLMHIIDFIRPNTQWNKTHTVYKMLGKDKASVIFKTYQNIVNCPAVQTYDKSRFSLLLHSMLGKDKASVIFKTYQNIVNCPAVQTYDKSRFSLLLHSMWLFGFGQALENEPRHEETGILHMRKQRRRSAPLFSPQG